jgi:hypothetical protein
MLMPPHIDLNGAPLWVRYAYLAMLIVYAVGMSGCGIVLLWNSRKSVGHDAAVDGP